MTQNYFMFADLNSDEEKVDYSSGDEHLQEENPNESFQDLQRTYLDTLADRY